MKAKIVYAPGHPEAKLLAETLASKGMPPEAELIYRARNSVYSLTLPDSSVVNIKAFKEPGAINSYVYTHLRKSKARRSFENSLRLTEMGFGTPEPLAYVEITDGARLRGSFYVSRQLRADDMRHWEQKTDAEPLLRALASEMARLHTAGVWHKDFSPGNILYRPTKQGGYTFYLIDVNRMEFGVHDRDKLMDNFRAINIESHPETMRLARYYAEAQGLDPEATAREADRRLCAYLRKKQRLRSIKALLRLRRS